ncbi:MAG: MBL fold metallo-hydrolase [Candidatus Lernaella stagnicola]|nr:MBL fold metallo-hydrolase [Candidatus Lernaella stagnicola]
MDGLNPPYVVVLDVGHGNSAVLVDTNGVTLIDLGPGPAIIEALTSLKIVEIGVVFITHADSDHAGGLIQLLAQKEIKIGRLVLNPDGTKETFLWEGVARAIQEATDEGRVKLRIDLSEYKKNEYDQGEVNVEIVGPTKYLALRGVGGHDKKNRRISSNSLSGVLRLFYKEKPEFLFAADIDTIGLDDLTERGKNMQASVVVIPHHGGGDSGGDAAKLTRRLCQEAQSETVVISHGRKKYNNPKENVIKAVKETLPGARIVCTQLSKSCAPELTNGENEHLSHVFAAGREGGMCCGGSVIFLLDPKGTVPSPEEHLAFVKCSAPSALCIGNDNDESV